MIYLCEVNKTNKAGGNRVNTAKSKMTTTTAKCTRAGQSPKYIPNAVNFKGYLVGNSTKGVGTPITKGGFNSEGEGEVWDEYKKYEVFYRPYFNNDIIIKKWDKEKFKKEVAELDVRQIIGTEYEISLIKFGENEGGLLVEDVEDVKNKTEAVLQDQIQKKEIPIEIANGHFGLFLKQRLSNNIFKLIAGYGNYMTAEEIDDWFEDMDDFSKVGEGKYLKGWYFKNEIIDVLKNHGFEVNLSK